ncbi:hypothetical protein ACPPVO_35645 [Dactylosporangium sp. McL0621]|uniref:hypothetical protein n=1 Tax=Dactylosporangium sp. McL0621 TaxID=3415678 RepID=UPI003CE9A14D
MRTLCAVALVLTLAGCGAGPASRSAAVVAGSSSAAASGPFTVPEDYVAVGSGTRADTFGVLGVTPKQLPLGAALAGPHFGFWIDATAVLQRITPEQQRAYGIPSEDINQVLLPGAGREFLLTRMNEHGTMTNPAKPNGPLKAAVVVNGAARPIKDAPTGGDVVVVAVPVGADPLLSVTDEGRTQSITLRTGQRRDNIPLCYPLLENQVRLEDLIHVPSLNKADETYWMQATIWFTLRPWIAERGWAPNGRAWLVVNFDLDVPHDFGYELKLAPSLKITGATVPIPGDLVLRTDHSWSTFVDVPDSLRKLGVTFRASGSVYDLKTGKPLPFTRYDKDNHRDFTLAQEPEYR